MPAPTPPAFPNGPIPPNQTWRMEQFSEAYITAVASAAGCKVQRWGVDDECVDVVIGRRSAPGCAVVSPRLEVQLKATTSRCRRSGHVAYPVDIATYDALRMDNVTVPRVIVVVLVPRWAQHWTKHTEARLALHHCAYWYSLRGMPASGNGTSCTLHIPRSQALTSASLDAIFTRLENGGLP